MFWQDVYKQFLVATQIWPVLSYERCLGQQHRIDQEYPHQPRKNLLQYCTACPEYGVNLEPRWENTPHHIRYAIFSAIAFNLTTIRHIIQCRKTLDGNHHTHRYQKKNQHRDASLFDGRSLFLSAKEHKLYTTTVPQLQQVTHCIPKLSGRGLMI